MKRIFWCIILVLLFNAAARAEDFSADFVLNSKEGNFSGKVYAKKDKVRMEIDNNVMISRADKNIAWMLMPEEKTYLQIPLQPQNIINTSDKMAGEIGRRKLVTESFNGKIVDKYEIEYNLNGRNEKILAWMSNDLNFPVKSSAVDGSWSIEYTNVIMSEYPDDLFEIPSDYHEFSIEVPGAYADK